MSKYFLQKISILQKDKIYFFEKNVKNTYDDLILLNQDSYNFLKKSNSKLDQRNSNKKIKKNSININIFLKNIKLKNKLKNKKSYISKYLVNLFYFKNAKIYLFSKNMLVFLKNKNIKNYYLFRDLKSIYYNIFDFNYKILIYNLIILYLIKLINQINWKNFKSKNFINSIWINK